MNTKKAKRETIVLAILNIAVAFSTIIYDIPAIQAGIGKFVQNHPYLPPELYPIIFMVHSARLFNEPVNLE